MMIKNTYTRLVMIFALMTAISAGAMVVSSDTKIEPGVWNSNYKLAKAYADENHLPIVVFWGSSGCGYCNSMKTACSTSEFTDWQADCGMVLAFAQNTDTVDGAAAKSFTGKGNYPRMRIYWKKADGTESDSKPFAGRLGQMPNGGSGTLAGQLINAIKAVTKGYVPASSVYYGGEFADEETVVTNGVETSVTLRLERENDVKTVCATNWVVTTLNDGEPVTNSTPVVWAVSETAKEYSLDLDAVGLDYTVTNLYKAVLLSDDYESKSSTLVRALPYPYKGGRFTTVADKHACLEAETDTESVTVSLVRTLGEAFSQKLVISAPGKTPVTNTVDWKEGELSKSIEIEMDDWYVADKKITISILDELDAFSTETAIACVGTVKNSSANPYWLGERTAETLGWGEWTMDLVAATQKVAAAEGDAYTLILVGGSKWCPDCVKTERWLLDQPDFETWAKARHVACVNIDLPKIGDYKAGITTVAESPSLLSSTPFTVSDRYVQACEDGEESRVQSGAGYLSRHEIPLTGNGGTNATDVTARNVRLFMTGTDEGGLCRPDCINPKNAETGVFKTGVPCLIVMDKTGRIIGRNFQFNNESPAEYKSAYIERMNELLAQSEDDAEEANDSRMTTEETLSLRGKVEEKTISYNDINDWYRIDEGAKGSKVQYRLTGTEDAVVELKVVQVIGETEKKVASVTNNLKDGVVLDVASMPSSNCYLRVGVPLTAAGITSGFFALTNMNTTVAKYTLVSDGVLKPTESSQQFTVAPGEDPEVTVEIVSGKAYRLDGVEVYETEKLNYVLDEDLYVAKESGTTVISLTDQTLTYQIWNTGNVAFERATGSEQEPSSEEYITHRVKVRRNAGTSGKGLIKVAVDKDRSTKLPGIFEFEQEGEKHEWKEGDADDWELEIKVLANDYSDGTQKVVLVLEKDDDSVVGLGTLNEYTLTISDNDVAKPGKVQIKDTNPVKAGSYVYAKAEGKVTINVNRIEGSDGQVGCTLAATAGKLDEDSFTWASRETDVQTAELSLAGVAVGTLVKVRLTPDEGVKTLSSAREFTVKVIAADAPGFDCASKEWTIYRNVDIDEGLFVNTVKSSDLNVKVTKIAGQVPGGIRYAYDPGSGQLVFRGIPTAAVNRYEASFQISVNGVKGETVSVVFKVLDPVKPATTTGKAMNPACAVTRNFNDMQVYSDAVLTRLIGLISLTIPPSGRLSAKYVTTTGTISMKSDSWCKMTGSGELVAVLTGVGSKNAGYELVVFAYPDGQIACTIKDPVFGGKPEVLRAGDDWNVLDDGAADWEGYYTVSLAQRKANDENILAKGDGYLTLKMNTASAIKKGKMAYAGVLPNGKAISGSRTLWGYYDKGYAEMVLASLAVFNTSTKDDACGLIFIKPDAKTEYQTERRSISNSLTDYYGLSYTNVFVWTSKEGEKYEAGMDVYGGYYDPNENLAECCKDVFEKTTLTFFAQPDYLVENSEWSTNDTAVSVALVSGKNSLKLVYPTNAQNLTLSFNRSAGTVSGTMDLPLLGGSVKANYKGVVMPGWGTAKCEGCSDPKEAQLRPFVSGTCTFKVNKVTFGCPFSIGLEEGR